MNPYDNNKLSIFDKEDSKLYNIDLTNPGVCLDYVSSLSENQDILYLW